jgi:hypothetical protein
MEMNYQKERKKKLLFVDVVEEKQPLKLKNL